MASAGDSVGICDPGSPVAEITRAAGGPLLAKVAVTSGGCQASACSTGCESISVYGGSAQIGGPACQLTVTTVDGRTQSVQLSVVQNPSPTYACCDVMGRSDGVALDPTIMSPATVSVNFEGTDAGFYFGDGGLDGGSPEPPSSDAGTTGMGFD